MVTFIHSLSAGFGSHVIAGDTGILLNNRVGRGFTLEEGHPNVIEGGKRTMHTLNCFAIAKDGEMLVVGGTPGGDQQPQWNMQIISNLIDHDMDVQQAVEAPRWQSSPGTDPINLGNPFEVRIESRVSDEVLDDLRGRGHTVRTVGPYGLAARPISSPAIQKPACCKVVPTLVPRVLHSAYECRSSGLVHQTCRRVNWHNGGLTLTGQLSVRLGHTLHCHVTNVVACIL